MNTNDDTFRQVLDVLRRLKKAKIPHRLAQAREDAIMIAVDVPGERWEIEFVDYDDEVHVEVERFVSNGTMGDESLLAELIARHAADAEPSLEETKNQP